MVSVDIKPNLLSWARERAGKDLYSLERSFPKLADWESGRVKPTLKQIERFAKATYTPVGYFFLEEPPVEKIPIPDFPDSAKRIYRKAKSKFTGHPIRVSTASRVVP